MHKKLQISILFHDGMEFEVINYQPTNHSIDQSVNQSKQRCSLRNLLIGRVTFPYTESLDNTHI